MKLNSALVLFAVLFVTETHAQARSEKFFKVYYFKLKLETFLQRELCVNGQPRWSFLRSIL